MHYIQCTYLVLWLYRGAMHVIAGLYPCTGVIQTEQQPKDTVQKHPTPLRFPLTVILTLHTFHTESKISLFTVEI